MSIENKTYFQSTSGNVKTVGHDGTVIVKIKDFDSLVFRDYIELLCSVSGGDIDIMEESCDALIHTPELYKLAKDWEWKDFFYEDMDISEVWGEAQWFQRQINGAFGLEDSLDIVNWRGLTPTTDKFGEW